jgi:hypothetical protein
MEGKRFDQLARAAATSGSRRRVLSAVLAGGLTGLWARVTAADDSGTAIADASGGNHNQATATDPASGRNEHHDRDDADGDRDDERNAKDDNREDKENVGGAPDEGGAPDQGGAADSSCLCSSGTCCPQS